MSRTVQDTRQIGERLRSAREASGVTQAEAAQEACIARTTLVAIEKGQRRVRIDELQTLAKLYKTSANAILRTESIHVDLVPRFRRLVDSEPNALEEAVSLLAGLARAEVELENLLGIRRLTNFPPERPILPGDVLQQAERDATELRERLGLGLSPVRDIVTLLELELGVRVFVRQLRGQVSGIFAYDDSLGACILLNANHRIERRRFTAGHELGHLVATRREPEILVEEPTVNSREERYADAFSRSFLTPGRAVAQKFHEVTAGAGQLTRRHVVILGHFFGVSREAIVRRLEELGIAKSGTWDWFARNGGITDEHERQVLGDLRLPDLDRSEALRPTTLRLSMLAAEAHRRELLSEGQLSRLLKLDRLELREVLDDIESEGSDLDGQLDLK